MFQRISRLLKKGVIKREGEIYPDEIFIDSENLPEFDVDHFEGRLEQPVGKKVFAFIAIFFALVGVLFAGKIWMLQIREGRAYEEMSANNHLKHTIIFADRGIIYDRNKKELAWNIVDAAGGNFSLRRYAPQSGLAHILGYVSYPSKDKYGFYYDENFTGKDGVESYYNETLAGENGLKITETDVMGNVQSESVLRPPRDGNNIYLSVDSRISEKLYDFIKSTAAEYDFAGGAGIILDVKTGEVLSLVSFPEFSSGVITDGEDKDAIRELLANSDKPFLNRAIGGLYTPGSIVKPFIAVGALEEGIIDPKKQILSTGQIEVPNPYNPEQKSVFKDWKAHGWVDMRQAIAVSSNVYFFSIGGGYENQKGLGITKIAEYLEKFGLGNDTGIDLNGEQDGLVPTPEWKKNTFNDDLWRLGDTYNTSIGQYGFQVTALQMARTVASLANGGTLVTPTVLLRVSDKKGKELGFNPDNLKVAREGMRLSVTDGIASSLAIPGLSVAAKTGTAELGVTKERVNSWVTGFFPYENPRFSFAVVMEKGPRSNTIGATYVMRQLLDWMNVNTLEYAR